MALLKKKQEEQAEEKKKPAKASSKKARKSPVKFVKEVIAELKKVTWPTRRELISYSLVVVVFIILMALFLLLMDTIFGRLLALIV